MRKTQRFAFKLTIEDRVALQRLADLEGEQAAVIVRRLIRQAIVLVDGKSGIELKTKPVIKSSNVSIGN